MKKNVLVALLLVSGAVCTAPTQAADNKMAAGAKKVGAGIAYPFKKAGEGMKTLGHKIRHPKSK